MKVNYIIEWKRAYAPKRECFVETSQYKSKCFQREEEKEYSRQCEQRQKNLKWLGICTEGQMCPPYFSGREGHAGIWLYKILMENFVLFWNQLEAKKEFKDKQLKDIQLKKQQHIASIAGWKRVRMKPEKPVVKLLHPDWKGYGPGVETG